MSTDVSIVIVNYSADALTTACLDSLLEAEVEGVLHVIIVDNGSPTPYVLPRRVVSSTKFSTVLLRSESNLGFTGGNNMGIHAAIERFNSDFVMLLNNDTIVDKHFLTRLLTFARLRPSAGIISPKIYFAKNREFHSSSYARSEKGKVLWYAGGAVDWSNLDCFHRGVDELDRGQFAHQTTSDYATGCCALVRRETLEKISYLDKRFFLYYEDTDWSQKAKQFGYSIGYCDDAVVWHVNAGSSQGAGSDIHQYYQTRNRLLFFWRYGAARTRVTLVRFALTLLTTGTKLQHLAVWHFLTGKLGKQPLS